MADLTTGAGGAAFAAATVSRDPDGGAADDAVRIAPYALLRVAGLPYRAVADLRLARTSALVERAIEHGRAMEREREPLEDALHAAIPGIVDRRLRGLAVELRRDVHNARRPRLGDDGREAVLAALPEATRQPVASWWTAADRVAATVDEGERALREEVCTHLRPSLFELLHDGPFDRALALASPDLHEQCERISARPRRDPTPARAELALLTYVARASAKTSPFSTFMFVGDVPVLPGVAAALPGLGGARRTSSVALNRGMLARVARAAASRPPFAGPLLVGPGLRDEGGGRLAAIGSEITVLNGRPWRADRAATFRLHPQLAAFLAAVAGRSFEPAALLAELHTLGLEAPQALALLGRLIERGLIGMVARSDAYDPQPEAVGAALPEPVGGQVPERAEPLTAATAAAVHEARGRDRRRLIAAIRGAERRALAGAGAGDAPPYRDVVLEDGHLESLDGAVGGLLAARLAELGRWLRGRIVIDAEYAWLRDTFVARFGESGRCEDLVAFIAEASRLLSRAREVGLPRGVEPAPLHARRAAVTALVQLHGDRTAVAAGETPVVVNRLYEGAGWLAARYGAGRGSGGARYRAHLQRWLADVAAPREPIDLPIAGECNNLQAHPRLTPRVLAWPAEPLRSDTPGALPIADVSLVHDPASGLLELLDPAGARLEPVYLGAAMPSPGWGLTYLLTLLARPYRIDRPAIALPDDGGDDVVAFERVVDGNVVVGRATWWVRAAHLHRDWLEGDGFRQLLGFAAARRRFGIPDVFFAQPFRTEPAGGMPAPAAKPGWIDAGNPWSLAILGRLAMQADWVAIKEPLPSADGLWLGEGHERFVSELQVEFTIE